MMRSMPNVYKLGRNEWRLAEHSALVVSQT